MLPPAFVVRHRHWLAALIFVLIPLVGFGSIAEDVRERKAFPWEKPVILAVHSLQSRGLTDLFYAMSVVGGVRWGWAVPAVILLLAWRVSRASALFFLLAVGGSTLLNVGLKLFFHRDRPTILIHLWQANDYSFPSGHAMLAAAIAAAVTALLWRTRFRTLTIVLGGLYALLMDVARVYLGVHYPTDVLAGTALSVAWVSGIALLFWPLLHRAQHHARAVTAPEPDDGRQSLRD